MIDVDLHLHTHYSDGAESPRELVERAHREGLRTIAVTDHDGIQGVEEALLAAKALGIRVIPGLEFSVEFLCDGLPEGPEMHSLHILGYGIDLSSKPLLDKMEEILRNRADRNDRLCRAFAEKGIAIEPDELEEASPVGFVGKRSFAAVFLRKGMARSVEEAFSSKQLMANPAIRSIRKEKTSAGEAIRIIHQAGGKAFWAHPFQLDYASPDQDPDGLSGRLALVAGELAALGLDGLEAYYPTHDRAMTEFLLALADRSGLLVSIGSDDHGPQTRRIKKIHSFQVEADIRRLEWVKDL